MIVRTRFAPSPTGFLHVGGVRTALFAWIFAKKYDGQFILRIEDTDKAREVEGSISHIIECLRWLGIDWDEGVDSGGPHAPYVQSERLESYRKYAEQLVAAGHAYPDPYTEEEVEVFRQKAEAEKRPFLYRDFRPTTCAPWDGATTLRFKVPELKRYVWNDLVRGELSAGAEALDDFILIKGDGYPTYNFAHIIDDLEMNVTHIMRGEEFISSTPKFLSLYEALGISRPEIATMPVILGPDGKKKLSKRDGARDILDYRAEGYVPHAIVNFLVLLGWHPEGTKELLSLDEIIDLFDITHVQKGGAKLDEDKLLFINHHWMRALSDQEYLEVGLDYFGDLELDGDMLRKVVPLLKERSRTFKEARAQLTGELEGLFRTLTLSPAILSQKEPLERPGLTKEALESLLEPINGLQEDVSAEVVKETILPLADAEEAKGKGGRGAVLWPLRYALSGQERSPDPFTLVHLLGPLESASRVRAAIAIL